MTPTKNISRVLTARNIGVLLAIATISGCGRPSSVSGTESNLLVDMGAEGNAQAVQNIRDFQKKIGDGFILNNGRKRALLTGFNPFQGGTANVSGDLVTHLETLFSNGSVERRQGTGVTLSRGELQIGSEILDVYYLRADTNYSSPAMIHTVAAMVKPDRILSFGQSSRSQVEQGAINSADTSTPGYVRDGSESVLMNQSARVDEIDSSISTTEPTWDPNQLKESMEIPVSQGPRASNNYICDATEYTMQKSISGRNVNYFPGMRLTAIGRGSAAQIQRSGSRRFAFIHLAPSQRGMSRTQLLDRYGNSVRRALEASFKAQK